MAANIVSIAPHLPFLDTLARRWLAAHPDDPSRGLILLPTRRAARALAESFLHVSGGRPMLLPRIVALGALDEAALALSGALDLPPAVEPQLRLALLARLILRLPEAQGGVATADRAWALAQELAALMDEAERAELDLPAALAAANAGNYAEHWEVTLRFLGIVTRAWPDWLAEQGLMNPAARQVTLLRGQARAWREAAPDMPVWAAGSTGGIPAVAALLRVAAGLPSGLVVLPGLDLAMAASVWEGLDRAHPQATLAALLDGVGARREEVAAWDGDGVVPPGRAAVLGTALLPAAALDSWRRAVPAEITGLYRLDAADQQEEAAAIALVLREALEVPGRSAALVTPDRALAARVSAELLRWGVVADDSAGEPLAQTPPAVFLRLLARAAADGLAPVALLAVLKHPFAAAGLRAAECRDAARRLERSALRGARPTTGLVGLRLQLQKLGLEQGGLPAFLARLEDCLAPLLRVFASVSTAPAELLAALVAAAEALAATDSESGPARLWAQEEGEALAAHLALSREALRELPDGPPAILPNLLDALLEGPAVRSRRALRGRADTAEHARVSIWGLLEARLQSADVVVLGGLAETVWPPATEPGPWMSRQMRALAGLPDADERIGQSAHDFVMAACSAPVAVLSCPQRRDRAPAVPARWLARLDALLAGLGQSLPPHPAVGWARALDLPADGPRPAAAPLPSPAAALRPRRLSVSDVATLMADPYAIYAKHVLRLRPLEPLDQDTDALDIGNLVHKGLELFLAEAGAAWPSDAAARLEVAMERALLDSGVRPALRAWWRPRLLRIAGWLAAHEATRRAARPLRAVRAEVSATWQVGDVELHGRADRIELCEDGGVAIVDYKTGVAPGNTDVSDGAAPQLLIEAAMARAGAFGEEFIGSDVLLSYWRLSGGQEAGEERRLFQGQHLATADEIDAATAQLRRLLAEFAHSARAYPHAPHPSRRPRYADYAQLARAAEWGEASE